MNLKTIIIIIIIKSDICKYILCTHTRDNGCEIFNACKTHPT
jgi:putative ribosome biogenesis GTPase RsgA